MRTVLQELKEKFEFIQRNNCKKLHEVMFFDGVLAIIDAEFIDKEKKQIIDAYNSGERALSHHIDSAKEYYDETFKTT